MTTSEDDLKDRPFISGEDDLKCRPFISGTLIAFSTNSLKVMS